MKIAFSPSSPNFLFQLFGTLLNTGVAFLCFASVTTSHSQEPVIVKKVGSNYQIQFVAEPGQSYVLEESSDLRTWSEVPAIPLLVGGITYFQVPASIPNPEKHFWHVIKVATADLSWYFDQQRISGRAYGSTAAMLVIPDSPPAAFAKSGSSPSALVGSGTVDADGRTITNILPLFSINDQNHVAFMGEITDGGGIVRRNIFRYTLGDSSPPVAALNVASVFEQPYSAAQSGPSQDFGAPMLDNSGYLYAWRRLNAVVFLSFVQTAPLTYIEKWAVNPPGPSRLPIAQIAMGDAGVAAAYPLITWLNPITANIYPTPYRTNSPWNGMYSPARIHCDVNNSGQMVFGGLAGSGYLATSATTSYTQAIPMPIQPFPWPRIADNGSIVARFDLGGGASELKIFNYALTSQFTLAQTGPLFSRIDRNIDISDDGRFIVFYGDYVGPVYNSSYTQGPGVFAFVNRQPIAPANASLAGGTMLVRLAGISGNGKLDPNELHNDANGNGRVDPGEDQGKISGFPLTDQAVSVGSDGTRATVVFVAQNLAGQKASFGTFVELKNDGTIACDGGLQQIEAVGGSAPSGTITDLTLFDSLNNQGRYVSWVQSTGTSLSPSLAPAPAGASLSASNLPPVDILEIISDQISGNEANKLPTGKPFDTDDNNPMLMGARSGTTAAIAIRVNFPIAYQGKVFVGVRKFGGASVIHSVPALVAPAKTLLQFNADQFAATESHDFSNLYEVVAGYDSNANTSLEQSEVTGVFRKTAAGTKPSIQISRDKFRVVTKAYFDTQVGGLMSEAMPFGVPAYGIGSYLLKSFLDGITPPEATTTILGITSAEKGLIHPLGAIWSPGNFADINLYTFAEGTSVSDSVENSSPVHQAINKTLFDQRYQILAYLNSHSQGAPYSFSYPFTAEDGFDPFINPTLFLAFGKVTIQGNFTAQCSLIGPMFDPNSFQVEQVTFNGNFEDLYDFAYFGPAVSIPGFSLNLSVRAAAIQAGSATLSPVPPARPIGRVFKSRVEFEKTVFPWPHGYHIP